MTSYGVTIFLSALLLFLIQPMISKFILPIFGGSASVWSVSLMFFLVVLLLGYGYANWITSFSRRAQIVIHFALVILTFFLVSVLFFTWPSPVTPSPDSYPPEELPPSLRVLAFLILTVGLPYFILTTTSSLLQFWYGQIKQHSSPYSFYALSNAGSLLAVMSYPFLIEPVFSLRLQGLIWSGGFLVYAVALSVCGVFFWKLGRVNYGQPSGQNLPGAFRTQLLWLGLSFLPVLMLLAITNQLTQRIAPLPLLWLLPLAVYLLSFIISFSGSRYFQTGYPLLFLVAIPFLLLSWRLSLASAALEISFYVAVLFLIAMTCHNKLYELRPGVAQLTRFYLVLALGGALGGLFVSLISPLIFKGFWEFHLGLFLSVVVALWVLKQEARPWFTSRQAWLITASIFLVLSLSIADEQKDVLRSLRNFYGTLIVRQEQTGKPELKFRTLLNGRIVHGSQWLGAGLDRRPTSYYSKDSGVGLALSFHPSGEKLKVGGIGLGAGTVAAYCGRQDYFRFYEINPEVVKIAHEFFTYLRDCPGKIEVVQGDARLVLERELHEGQAQNFDILILDAFTDGAIPVHLLTKEAFAIYLAHLHQDGILAVHISNAYLNLYPVVLGAAGEHGLETVRIDSPGSQKEASYSATWVLAARSLENLNQEKIIQAASRQSTSPRKILWTDSFSNLLQVLR